MRKVAFYTLGCKVNQYETEAVGTIFQQGGYEIVDFREHADIYVINTCTVTGLSDRKSRQIIRRARQINPNGLIVVMGCYPQTAPDEVMQIPEVNLILGTRDRNKILDYIVQLNSPTDKINAVYDIMSYHIYDDMQVGGYRENTRAFIKIEDGCSQFCTYCIIPYARGPVRSRAPSEILQEIQQLQASNYQEIVLTGIHLASYGKDTGITNLAEITSQIHHFDGIKRIRLGSLEPSSITKEFIKQIKVLPKVCPHFHISLQSGCNDTLKRMNRKYTTKEYKESILLLREQFQDVAITTDVMVGFPGETEDEFSQSLSFCKEIQFSKIHVFKYSPRRGTPAEKFKCPVPAEVKELRSKQMIALTDQCQANYNGKFINRMMPVLFEQKVEKKQGFIEGLTVNYIKVICEADDSLIGTIHNVVLTEAFQHDAFGKIVSQ